MEGKVFILVPALTYWGKLANHNVFIRMVITLFGKYDVKQVTSPFLNIIGVNKEEKKWI
jgi:hypothetical protein